MQYKALWAECFRKSFFSVLAVVKWLPFDVSAKYFKDEHATTWILTSSSGLQILIESLFGGLIRTFMGQSLLTKAYKYAAHFGRVVSHF